MSIARRVSKWMFYGILFPATLGVCAWQGWLWWSWASSPVLSDASLTPTTLDDATVQIEIPPGTSAQQIGNDLHAAGLIRSPFAWRLWIRWQTFTQRDGSFLAGTYEISPTDSLEAIATQIWNGEVVHQSVTIPEGWTIQQMANELDAQGLFSAEEFIQATQTIPTDQYPWLPKNLTNLEGFLYPDTYQLTDNSTAQSLVNQMLDRFEEVALPIYEAGRKESPYSLLEWVTLASIVEKEAVVSSERPLIASVFAKRLREDIPLGADPTVEYALRIQQTPERPLTFDEVATPSPYNTYMNVGLPPGPIASPGLASLEASLNPEDTEFLFFMARYDGTHIFSRTLAEHEAAKALVDDELNGASESPSEDSSNSVN
jgi:UPF0755 protein